MSCLLFNKKIRIVHFVGIGGIGISGLAQHLFACGCTVSGSDRTKTQLTENLKSQGITVSYGHSADNIPQKCNLVVYSSAVPFDNVELIEARRRKIPLLVREQLLGIIFDSYRERVAVSGVHGKTTVTAMLDFVLRKLSQSHTAFVGGVLTASHSNYCRGEKLVVAEACEFHQSFKYLHPTIAVVLNVELDHPDCYRDTAEIYGAFNGFLNNVDSNGTVVVNGDQVSDKLYRSHGHITFGLGTNNYARAINIEHSDGKYRFDYILGDNKLCNVRLNVQGRHNIYNALATLTTLVRLGFQAVECAEILNEFCGAERRWQQRKYSRCCVIEDYAHHPTEIKASIATALDTAKGKVYVFFQPHTYTRTKALWNDFVQCFQGADYVGILDIYSAREQSIEGIDGVHLAKAIMQNTNTQCNYFDGFESAEKYIVDNVKSNDTVLILGAGDIYKLSELLERTEQQC